MEFINLSKRFMVLTSAFFITGAVDCAALGSRQNQEISIQKIIGQWAAIERSFIEEQFLDSKDIGGR